MRKAIAAITIAAATALVGTAPAADAASCGRDAFRALKPGGYSPSGVYTTGASERRAPRVTLCLINNERAAAGVAPLRYHALLGALANRQARDLVNHGITAGDPHKGSDGSTVESRLRPYTANFGRASWRIAETVVEGPYSSPLRAVRWWMNSPDHRDILLDPALEEVGIATFAKRAGGGPGGTYVADFGTVRN